MVSVPSATLFGCILVVIFISAVPSNVALPATSPLTWIVLAVSSAVAVAAFPVVSWFSVPTTKSIVPSSS